MASFRLGKLLVSRRKTALVVPGSPSGQNTLELGRSRWSLPPQPGPVLRAQEPAAIGLVI